MGSLAKFKDEAPCGSFVNNFSLSPIPDCSFQSFPEGSVMSGCNMRPLAWRFSAFEVAPQFDNVGKTQAHVSPDSALTPSLTGSQFLCI